MAAAFVRCREGNAPAEVEPPQIGLEARGRRTAMAAHHLHLHHLQTEVDAAVGVGSGLQLGKARTARRASERVADPRRVPASALPPNTVEASSPADTPPLPEQLNH